MAVRHGYLATWHGVEYDASPAPDGVVRLYAAEPAEGFVELAPGRYRTVVPADEISQLTYVRTTCVWRGAPCLVIGGHGVWLRLEYLGDDGRLAEQLGMDRFDVAVYQGWAPQAEVTDLVERRI